MSVVLRLIYCSHPLMTETLAGYSPSLKLDHFHQLDTRTEQNISHSVMTNSSVTNSRADPQQTPLVEKHAHPPRVVYCAIYTVADLEGVRVVRLNPPSGTKLFQFHGEIYEKSGKMLKTNPLLMDLNPISRNLVRPCILTRSTKFRV